MNEDDAPPNLVDLLDRLAQPEPPAPIAMTPQTWGWAVLAFLVALAIAYLAWRYFKRWHANAYRRAALRALAAAGDDAVAIATIVRRTAIAAYGREKIAGLVGQDWVAFLGEGAGDAEKARACAEVLQAAPYVKVPRRADDAVRAAAANWVRHHRVERQDGAAP